MVLWKAHRREEGTMRTPASIAGHPLHPILIVFPAGLLIFSLVCDLISLGNPGNPNWSIAARYAMVGGLVGALAAAIPGVVDLLSLTDRHVKRIALIHMGLNTAAVVLYAASLWLRLHGAPVANGPLLLSLAGAGLLSVSGWLGGAMVHRHGVGVSVEP
jgi:uncharacterized membrane protein